MAYIMKESPHKRGVIQGTPSALKLGGLIKLAKTWWKYGRKGMKPPKGGDKATKL
jgi:hypothetical protein